MVAFLEIPFSRLRSFSVVSTSTSTIIATRSYVNDYRLDEWTNCDCFLSFVVVCLFRCFFVRTHHKEKEQIEDGLLVSPPKTHATYYTIPFSFHRKTITFLCHTKFTNTKNVKKRSSSSPRYLYTYFGAEFRISGQVSTYIAIRIYCIYMSMSIVIEYELMLGRWMFTSSFSYFLQCAQTVVWVLAVCQVLTSLLYFRYTLEFVVEVGLDLSAV